MQDVALVKCDRYQSPDVEDAIKTAVDLVGGMNAFVKPGDRVLVKPNMLQAHAPERRVTTDPTVLSAVLRLVLDAGGKPIVADSPAMESARRVAKKSGLGASADFFQVPIQALGSPVRVPTPSRSVYRSLELSRDALDADVVINLPKLKTHTYMHLTLGVKNLFGTVVAQRKAEWHMAAGLDREAFANMLLDINRTIAPALTIMDGVYGMEGRGPNNGDSRAVGVIAASADALALDMALIRTLGVNPSSFPLFSAAVKRGLVQKDFNNITRLGDAADLVLKDFAVPQTGIQISSSGFLGSLTRRHIIARPIQNTQKCAACGKCVKVCPPQALTLKEHKLAFNYDTCIRCYCCQEVCDEDAIDFHQGMIGRLLNRLGR